MAKYKLTRPITSKGEADYWIIINKINNGVHFDQYTVRNKLFQYMTFQALKEAKLIDYTDRSYSITDLGKKYIEFYNIPDNRNFNFFSNEPIRKSKTITPSNVSIFSNGSVSKDKTITPCNVSINSLLDLDSINTNSFDNIDNIVVLVSFFDGSSNKLNFSNSLDAINCSKALFVASNVLNISISKGC